MKWYEGRDLVPGPHVWDPWFRWWKVMLSMECPCNLLMCTFFPQTRPDWQHGAGWGLVPLGVQGGRCAQGRRCHSSSCWRDYPTSCLHHHGPGCECLQKLLNWVESTKGCWHQTMCFVFLVCVCVCSANSVMFLTGVQHRDWDAVRGPLGAFWWWWHSAGVCQNRSLR